MSPYSRQSHMSWTKYLSPGVLIRGALVGLGAIRGDQPHSIPSIKVISPCSKYTIFFFVICLTTLSIFKII
jgi:hypothetical protein